MEVPTADLVDTTTDAPDDVDDVDDSVVLPWWRNPFNIVAIAIALAALGAGRSAT